MENKPGALPWGKHPLLWSLLGWFIMKRQDVSQLVEGSPNIPSMHKALGLAQALDYTGHPGKCLVAPALKKQAKAQELKAIFNSIEKNDTSPF